MLKILKRALGNRETRYYQSNWRLLKEGFPDVETNIKV